MIRILQIVCLLFIANAATSQSHVFLNPEERAYLYHIVKKSPILDQNIGRYFDYQGPDIRFANGALNFDSVELVIINQPELLVIRHQEIAKSTKGILAEASNKLAIWDLNKMLLAKRTKSDDFDKYESKYATFEGLLMEKLPPVAIKVDDDKGYPHPRLMNVLNPSLSLDDKIAQLGSMKGMTANDQLVVLRAINYAVNEYVEQKAKETFYALGGEADSFHNVLTAAGDGSITSGLLEEREKDEKGRWNKGLPKAIGLFPYDLKLTEAQKKKDPKVEPLAYTTSDFISVGDGRLTTLHFDVWGYNTSKQTTVVIEKNGLNYHLFGSGETRFLSPDSTFSSGKTFQAIINDLEFNKIAKLDEKIYGKKGFDFWIAHYNKKKDETELKIVKNEKAYSDMGYTPISTSSKPSRKVKKTKKNAIKGQTGADSFKVPPTTDSNKSSRKKKQNTIINLYGQFEWYKAKIKELEIEKEEALELRASYQQRLDHYNRLMGLNWAQFKEKDGTYTFSDSSVFDMYTQEFTFHGTDDKDGFEVRLIAIPESSLSNQADEVMLHISMLDAIPQYDSRVRLELKDQFASDKWELTNELLSTSDSVSILQFFESLLEKDKDFEIIARGQGVGMWDGARVVKDVRPQELSSYPGATRIEQEAAREDSTFKTLRRSELLINLNKDILLEVNSFTDPVKSSITVSNEKLIEMQGKYKLSKNDILSAYRTARILTQFKNEINVLAGTYLTREEAKIVIDRFNSTYSKVKVAIGPVSIKITELVN